MRRWPEWAPYKFPEGQGSKCVPGPSKRLLLQVYKQFDDDDDDGNAAKHLGMMCMDATKQTILRFERFWLKGGFNHILSILFDMCKVRMLAWYSW